MKKITFWTSQQLLCKIYFYNNNHKVTPLNKHCLVRRYLLNIHRLLPCLFYNLNQNNTSPQELLLIFYLSIYFNRYELFEN